MHERIREILLRGTLAMGLAAGGCSALNPSWLFDERAAVVATDSNNWETLNILPNNAFISLENAEGLQSGDIGLKRLYLASSDDAAMVLFYAVWDTTKINKAADNKFYLQPYQDHFSPQNFDSQKQFVNNSIPVSRREIFLLRARQSLPPDLANNWEQNYTFGLRKRPHPTSENVFVMKIFDKAGEQKLAYIRTRLHFESGFTVPVLK